MTALQAELAHARGLHERAQAALVAAEARLAAQTVEPSPSAVGTDAGQTPATAAAAPWDAGVVVPLLSTGGPDVPPAMSAPASAPPTMPPRPANGASDPWAAWPPPATASASSAPGAAAGWADQLAWDQLPAVPMQAALTAVPVAHSPASQAGSATASLLDMDLPPGGWGSTTTVGDHRLDVATDGAVTPAPAAGTAGAVAAGASSPRRPAALSGRPSTNTVSGSRAGSTSSASDAHGLGSSTSTSSVVVTDKADGSILV